MDNFFINQLEQLIKFSIWKPFQLFAEFIETWVS